MAECELNVAHAFMAAPSAHRLRHDVIVTSADDFDAASRRHRCDDGSEADRDSVIPHYRPVPSAFCPAGGGSEWVTLSKSVLLQLVERICQLSFQTDSLPATAACPSLGRLETSLVSTDGPSAAEQPSCALRSSPSSTLLSKVAATGSASEDVEISNIDSEPMTEDPEDVDDIPASDDVAPTQEISASRTGDEENRNDNDSELFTGPVAPEKATVDGDKTGSSSLSMDTPLSVSDSAAVAKVGRGASSIDEPPLTTTTPLRSTQSLRADRRRRLRELRRLRRHRQSSVAVVDHSHDLSRDRRHGAVVRRRFAVPHQPPPRFQDQQIADVERCPDRTAADASWSMQVPARCRYGRVTQPWSALNKLVVCQLVDVLLSQELAPPTTTWRSTTTSGKKRRSSGTIWNPAITPDTRECRTPPTVNDLSSVVSVSSAEPGSSTLLHSLLSPMSAASTFVDCRRSDLSVDVGADSLPWTASLRRRHHSAAAQCTFRSPWTPLPPSFFWYSVPPSQGNIFLLPDAASCSPCYRWSSAAQAVTMPLPPPSDSIDARALDYSARTLDADVCPDAAVDIEARESAGAFERRGPPRRRVSRPSVPPSSDGSHRAASSSRLKWVVVDKTDVCSLFESLASSMVADSDEKSTTTDETSRQPTTDSTAAAASPAVVEPIKWKSTLLRRARAEAQTPTLDTSDCDVVENTHDSLHTD